jgi:hypothetical protein
VAPSAIRRLQLSDCSCRLQIHEFACPCCCLLLQPELLYNLALCKFRLKDNSGALKHLADIIERGEREHPELHIGR